MTSQVFLTDEDKNKWTSYNVNNLDHLKSIKLVYIQNYSQWKFCRVRVCMNICDIGSNSCYFMFKLLDCSIRYSQRKFISRPQYQWFFYVIKKVDILCLYYICLDLLYTWYIDIALTISVITSWRELNM